MIVRVSALSVFRNSTYSRSGCTASAVFDTSVHGVVVHTRMRRAVRPGMPSASATTSPPTDPRSSATYTLGSSTSSYPWATSWLDSAVPHRAQYGRILCPRYSNPFRYSVASAHHTLSTYSDVYVTYGS